MWQATAKLVTGFNAARLPGASSQEVVDESEHEASLELVRTDFLKDGWSLRFKGGATYAPQAFAAPANRDPGSATHIQVGLGDDALGLASEGPFGQIWAKYDGKIKPFLRYRHTDAQNGFLDGHERYDDNVVGGFVFTTNAPEYSAGGKGFCKSNWKLSAGADIARNWSSDQTQRYWQVKATAVIKSPSLDLGVKPNLFASFEVARRGFDTATPSVMDRRDWIYKTSAGVEASVTIGGIAFSANGGVRYQVRNSNIAANDYDRTYGFGGLEAAVKF